jgi:hypothetical protein
MDSTKVCLIIRAMGNFVCLSVRKELCSSLGSHALHVFSCKKSWHTGFLWVTWPVLALLVNSRWVIRQRGQGESHSPSRQMIWFSNGKCWSEISLCYPWSYHMQQALGSRSQPSQPPKGLERCGRYGRGPRKGQEAAGSHGCFGRNWCSVQPAASVPLTAPLPMASLTSCWMYMLDREKLTFSLFF